jgi:syringomycin synthetase protein SyrE
MLEAIQRAGGQPPLILIHGLYGVMPIGHELSRVLGPDQPLGAINAWGFDGASPPLATVPEMAADYARQIRRAWPPGPYLVGGICSGGLLALEVARNLIAAGQSVGRVLLVDPPAMPFSYNDQLSQLDAAAEAGMRRRLFEQVSAELRGYATRYEYLPYDVRDPGRLQLAADVGVACMLAFFKHRPPPFAGAVELIVSDHRATGYFGPSLPWQSILTGPRWMHILPGVHGDMFRAQSDAVFRLISFYLETALADTDAPPETLARPA